MCLFQILLDKSSQSSDEEMEGFEQLEEVLELDLESDDDNEDEDDVENLEVLATSVNTHSSH